jgi:hypothetical protein
MSHRALFSLFLSFIFLSIFSGCGNDDDNSLPAELALDGVPLVVNTALILQVVIPGTDECGSTIYLTDGSVVGEADSVDGFQNQSFQLIISTISDCDNLPEGSFEISSGLSSSPIVDISYFTSNSDFTSISIERAEDGTLMIQKKDDEYLLDFDLKMGNGSRMTGIYEGFFEIIEFSLD